MATLTLRPNADGDYMQWDAEGGDYTRVDESSSDGDTTRLYTPTNDAVALFNLENRTIQYGTINSVTVYVVIRGLDPISQGTQVGVYTNFTEYWSATKSWNSTSYTTLSETWTTNPASGFAWTWGVVDSLQVGMKRISGGGQAVTQVYVSVDYTVPTGQTFVQTRYAGTASNDATTGSIAWTNPTNAITSDNTYATVALSIFQLSNYLKASNFGFNIPNSAYIKSINVFVEGKTATDVMFGGIYGLSPADAAPLGHTSNDISFGTSEQYEQAVANDDLLGYPYTASEINSSNFGVAMSLTTFGDDTASIDNFRIEVTYLFDPKINSRMMPLFSD